jgi:hypothetical protein
MQPCPAHPPFPHPTGELYPATFTLIDIKITRLTVKIVHLKAQSVVNV